MKQDNLPIFFAMKAGGEEITEERHGVVQLHLLVVQGQHKRNRRQKVMTLTYAYYCPQGKPKTYTVISFDKLRGNHLKLKYTMVKT